MKTLALVTLIALMTVFAASTTFAAENCGCTFTVTNPDHTQELGGKSGTNSHGGLHTAAERSQAVTHNNG